MVDILNKEKILEAAQRLVDDGKYEKAIAEYGKIVSVDPQDHRVKLKLAELYVKLKNVTKAIETYQEIATAYTHDGFYLKAVTVYKNVLRLNPALVDVNVQLAELYEKMGLNKDAVAQYQIVANLYDQREELDRLIEMRERIVALGPDHVTSRIKLAEAYQLQGREADALREYEAIVAHLEMTNDENMLIEFYEKILSQKENDVELARKLAMRFYHRGELKKALKVLDDHPTAALQDLDMLAVQAEMYARLNQVETAKTRYELLADRYVEAGDGKSALATYEKILVIAPDMENELSSRVEKIEEGALARIVAGAQDRRDRLAKIEEQRQSGSKEALIEELRGESSHHGVRIQSDGGREVVDENDQTMEPEGSGDEQAGLASLELGKVYWQMGLSREAGDEWRQALKLLQPLGRRSADYVRELESLLANIDQPIPQQTPVVVKSPVVEASKKEEAPVPPVPTKKPQFPPAPEPTSKSKKKISFV